MKATLSIFERNLPVRIETGAEVHESRTSIALTLEGDDFCGVAEVAPQNTAINGDAPVGAVLDFLTHIAIPRFLSVRERNLHHPHWAKVPTMFGNDAVSRVCGALIEGALYDGEVRSKDLSPVSPRPGIATGSLIGLPVLPVTSSDVGLLRIKVDASVRPESFDLLEACRIPVFLDYNGSSPARDVVAEHLALASVYTEVKFVEQVGRVGDFTAHGELIDLGVALSLDESIRSIQDLRHVARYRAATVVCIKPTRVGGRAVARSMIEEARSLNLVPYLGGFFETALGRFATAELCDEFQIGPSDTLVDGTAVSVLAFSDARGQVLEGMWATVASF